MVRTQIQLAEEKYRRLADTAHQLNRSMADCIREGIDLFLGRTGSADDLSDIAGKYRPLPTGGPGGDPSTDLDSDDSRWAEAILASKPLKPQPKRESKPQGKR